MLSSVASIAGMKKNRIAPIISHSVASPNENSSQKEPNPKSFENNEEYKTGSPEYIKYFLKNNLNEKRRLSLPSKQNNSATEHERSSFSGTPASQKKSRMLDINPSDFYTESKKNSVARRKSIGTTLKSIILDDYSRTDAYVPAVNEKRICENNFKYLKNMRYGAHENAVSSIIPRYQNNNVNSLPQMNTFQNINNNVPKFLARDFNELCNDEVYEEAANNNNNLLRPKTPKIPKNKISQQKVRKAVSGTFHNIQQSTTLGTKKNIENPENKKIGIIQRLQTGIDTNVNTEAEVISPTEAVNTEEKMIVHPQQTIGSPKNNSEIFDESEIEELSDEDEGNKKNPVRVHKSSTAVSERVASLFDREADERRIRIREYKNDDRLLIIYPDDAIKERWDIVVTLLLLYTAIITPYRIGFIESDSTLWVILDSLVDCLFGIDIILNFITAYYDDEENLVDERKKIALSYMKSWFFIDFVSIIPISLILNSKDYNSLARIARLPRIYRLLKMAKLARMLKIVKERNKFVKYLNEMLQLSLGVERILYFALIFFLLCHITACMWYFTAKIDELNPATWIFSGGFQDSGEVEIYIAAFYYTITTITTVGYGDISAGTTAERIIASILMIIGVMSYSFAIGSLSSVLTSLDSKQAKLKEKLGILEDLRREYNLSHNLYIKLKKALKYDHSRNASDKLNFLNELPQTLKVDLSQIMHKQIITKIPFFQNRSPHFIAFVGPMLRPLKVLAGEYIYVEGDPIDDIYFLINGSAAFVLRRYDDMEYVIINQGYYFGEADIIGSDDNSDVIKRMFTVKATKDCELLTLSKTDLLEVYKEFPDIVKELLKYAESRLKRALQIKSDAIDFKEYHSEEDNFAFQPQESSPNLLLSQRPALQGNFKKSTFAEMDENQELLDSSSESIPIIQENSQEEDEDDEEAAQPTNFDGSNTSFSSQNSKTKPQRPQIKLIPTLRHKATKEENQLDESTQRPQLRQSSTFTERKSLKKQDSKPRYSVAVPSPTRKGKWFNKKKQEETEIDSPYNFKPLIPNTINTIRQTYKGGNMLQKNQTLLTSPFKQMSLSGSPKQGDIANYLVTINHKLDQLMGSKPQKKVRKSISGEKMAKKKSFSKTESLRIPDEVISKKSPISSSLSLKEKNSLKNSAPINSVLSKSKKNSNLQLNLIPVSNLKDENFTTVAKIAENKNNERFSSSSKLTSERRFSLNSNSDFADKL